MSNQLPFHPRSASRWEHMQNLNSFFPKWFRALVKLASCAAGAGLGYRAKV